MYAQLLTGFCENTNEILYFDIEGRIYELNPILQTYVGTNKFVHVDYYGLRVLLLLPERVIVGGYNPIIDDITFEDVTSDE